MGTWPGDEAASYQVRPMEQAQELAQADATAFPQADVPPPPGYGQQLMYQQVQARSAALGVVASFFVPGLGSMLNEQVGKGIGILVCYFVSWIMAIATFGLGFILVVAVWIWGMVAANNDVHKWNRAHGIMS